MRRPFLLPFIMAGFKVPCCYLSQHGELKNQGSHPPHVRQWEGRLAPWRGPQACDVWRKDKQHDALERVKARFDSHQDGASASLSSTQQDRSKPQQDRRVTMGDLRRQQDRSKPQQDSRVMMGDLRRQQGRSKSQQDNGVGDDLPRRQQDRSSVEQPGPSGKRLPEGVHMQDVLRRLQMLEELEHAKMLTGISSV